MVISVEDEASEVPDPEPRNGGMPSGCLRQCVSPQRLSNLAVSRCFVGWKIDDPF